MNWDGASPQGSASAHLCTVKSGRDDTFVMCHPVPKLLKAQHGRGNTILPTGYQSLPSAHGPAPRPRNHILCPTYARAHMLPRALKAGGTGSGREQGTEGLPRELLRGSQ